MNNFSEIQALLQNKADYTARLALIPYDGSPEIKENSSGRYLYVRKRIGSRLTSTYVDVYSDELYQLLLKNTKEARELKKNIRKIDKQLADLGYIQSDLSQRVLQNIDFARINMKSNIYDQAILEGVATSFPQTETIIDNGTVQGMTANDIQKILNLKHAWEFILDKDVLQAPTDFYLLSHIAQLVNEGFYMNGGMVRGVPVTIGGSHYKPPLPIEQLIKEQINKIIYSKEKVIDVAVELCLYCMKTQIFIDGNKRASVIFANHYLIAHGQGFLVIPELFVPEFKKELVAFYEGEKKQKISDFLKQNCWKNF